MDNIYVNKLKIINMNKIELYNKHNELLLILIVEGDFDNENFTQILEESLIEYINENTDIDENEIDYYKLTDGPNSQL